MNGWMRGWLDGMDGWGLSLARAGKTKMGHGKTKPQKRRKLKEHVDDAENIGVSTVFELLEPMPSEICFMLWLQRENLGVQRQMPRSPRGSVPMNGWMRGWLDGWME